MDDKKNSVEQVLSLEPLDPIGRSVSGWGVRHIRRDGVRIWELWAVETKAPSMFVMFMDNDWKSVVSTAPTDLPVPFVPFDVCLLFLAYVGERETQWRQENGDQQS